MENTEERKRGGVNKQMRLKPRSTAGEAPAHLMGLPLLVTDGGEVGRRGSVESAGRRGGGGGGLRRGGADGGGDLQGGVALVERVAAGAVPRAGLSLAAGAGAGALEVAEVVAAVAEPLADLAHRQPRQRDQALHLVLVGELAQLEAVLQRAQLLLRLLAFVEARVQEGAEGRPRAAARGRRGGGGG